LKRASLALALALPALVCAAWTVVAGKDVNWDLLNYHYYLPYELLGGRLAQDFFAASAQSYLNPVGFLPFYLMVSANWHSIAVSVVLAVLHGLSLSLLFLISNRLFAHLPEGERLIFAWLGTGLGAATWVFWPTVGSSFLDPLLVPLMLAGLLLVLDARAPGRSALAGALFGAAAALKYSNALYVLAALPLAVAVPAAGTGAKLRAGAAFIAGATLAVGALAGPWMALLVREFGNPVFPLMNAWFKSPYAPAVNLVNARFLPGGWGDALSLPFRMVALDRHLYSETFAPDVRVAALVLLGAALPIARIRRALRPDRALTDTDWRLLAFLATGWVLWVASSANARYGMVLLLLAGAVLVRLAERLLPLRAARILTALLLLVQVAISIVAAPTRWYNAEPWSARWLPYEVPERAREPALYLSVEVLPMAVVAPFLNPASSFVNFRGQHSLPSDDARLAALIERHRGHIRALGRRLELLDGAPLPAAVKAYDESLRQLGYRLDPHDCFTLAWRPEEDTLARVANRFAVTLPAPEPLSVVSCGLRAAARDPADVEAERRISAVFGQIERRCPLLRGQTAVTEPFGSGWLRHYNGLDARLEAFGGGVALHRFGKGEIINLGPVSEWEREDVPLPVACAGSR
jgi:hypothetical protein